MLVVVKWIYYKAWIGRRCSVSRLIKVRCVISLACCAELCGIINLRVILLMLTPGDSVSRYGSLQQLWAWVTSLSPHGNNKLSNQQKIYSSDRGQGAPDRVQTYYQTDAGLTPHQPYTVGINRNQHFFAYGCIGNITDLLKLQDGVLELSQRKLLISTNGICIVF